MCVSLIFFKIKLIYNREYIIKYQMKDYRIHQELVRIFEQSEIFKFFSFLKSPKAKNVIWTDQTGPNPTRFYYETKKLRQASPQLSQCQNSLPFLLRRSGMKAKMVQRKQLKIGRWVVSHETLSINSTKQEIMEVWLKAQIAHFLESKSIITDIYHILQQQNSFVFWNEQGTSFTMSPKWDGYYVGLAKHLRRSGFTTLNFPQICHKYITRQSDVTSWLAVYLVQNFKDRAKRSRRRKRKLLDLLNDPDYKGKIKQEPVQDIKKQRDIDTKDSEEESINSSAEEYQQGNFPKDLLYFIKKSVRYKTMSVKSIIAIHQKQNLSMVLGPILILLDQIIRGSRVFKNKQSKGAVIQEILNNTVVNQQQTQTNNISTNESSADMLRNMMNRIEKLEEENKALKKMIESQRNPK